MRRGKKIYFQIHMLDKNYTAHVQYHIQEETEEWLTSPCEYKLSNSPQSFLFNYPLHIARLEMTDQ